MHLVNGRLKLEDSKSVSRAYLLIDEVMQSSNYSYFGLRDAEGRRTFSAYFALVKTIEGICCITVIVRLDLHSVGLLSLSLSYLKTEPSLFSLISFLSEFSLGVWDIYVYLLYSGDNTGDQLLPVKN